MPGSDLALQHLPERTGVDGHLGVTGRVHLEGRGCEDDVDPRAGTQLEVGLEGPRVAVEVLALTELQRVHEDRRDDRAVAGTLTRGGQERGVTGVQGSHRRDQDDLAGIAPSGRERVGELLAAGREERGGGHGWGVRRVGSASAEA